MSNLLEQSIIDAAALRETALKSAKAALIDKYKDEFQESVEKLLEQEDAPPSPPPEQAAMPPPDMNADMAGGATQEIAGGETFEDIPTSFFDEEGDPDELITIDFDKLKKQLEKSDEKTGILATPENPSGTAPPIEPNAETAPEQPEQNQQALSEELELDEELFNEYNQSHDMTKDALYEEDLDEKLSVTIGSNEEEEEYQEEYEQEYEFELEEQDDAAPAGESPELQKLRTSKAAAQGQVGKEQAKVAQFDQQIAVQMQKDNAAKPSSRIPLEEVDQDAIEEIHSDAQELEEDFELTEEEIQELAEELKVDLDEKHQLRGWMGTTSREKDLARDVELAKARDSKETEKRKKEEEKAKDLECKLNESLKENKKLLFLVEELKDNLISLKEHTEKLSLSNAKLLYINKVFGNNSLNERQKQNIVENISKASTVLEAKTIYGTLQSAVQSVVENKPKESLSEALNRSNSAFISRPRNQSSIDDSTAERMKILAGIK